MIGRLLDRYRERVLGTCSVCRTTVRASDDARFYSGVGLAHASCVEYRSNHGRRRGLVAL